MTQHKHHKIFEGYLKEVKYLSKNTGQPIFPQEEVALNKLGNYANQLDTFSTVCDIQQGKIMYSEGLIKWLTIPEEGIKKEALFQLIHPQYQLLYLANNLAIYESLNKFKSFLKADGSMFFTLFFPLKMKDGRYYQIKQMSMPFRVDAGQRVVQKLDVFRIIEPYRGQAAKTHFMSSQTDTFFVEAIKQEQRRTLLQRITRDNSPYHRKKYLPFRPRYYELLALSAKYPTASNKTIAQKMKIKENTVEGYNKEILKIANKVFAPHQFTRTKEVAQQLALMEVI